MTEPVQIRINDESREVAAGSTLLDLLRDLALADRRGVAVAINDTVVPRTDWPARALAAHDRVLVIRAAQGG